MAREQPSETEKRSKGIRILRATGLILAIAFVVVVALDGYLNHWGTFRTIRNWNTLVLIGNDGFDWELTASKDFELERIENPAVLTQPESLATFDRPFREAGLYRLYFRVSDSSSSTLKALYDKIDEIDTAHTMRQSIENAGRAYNNLQRLLGFDTTAIRLPPEKSPTDSMTAVDTVAPPQLVGSGTIAEQDLGLGTTRDVTTAVSRLIGKSPYAITGVGIGLLASAGLDLLKGDAYVATAPGDVFQMDNLQAGARAGTWEGKDIDILWLFAPGSQRPPMMPDSSASMTMPGDTSADSSSARMP